MDINVKTEYLKKVVSCTSRATSNKAIQPILNNILFSCDNGSLIVAATDLDLAIECKIPASVLKPGRVTIPAKKMDEIVSKVQGENTKISIKENQLAKIESDRSRFQVNGMPPEEFPEIIKKHEASEVYQIKQSELLRAISLTVFATSKFESTSVLSGANFVVDQNKFEIGATDGSRLARYAGSITGGKKGQGKQEVVIPGRALVELERLLNSFKEGNEEVAFYFMPGQVVFQNNDFSLSTRLVNGVFPNYDKLIPQGLPNKATFSRGGLLSALERVAVLANERTSVIKLTLKSSSSVVILSANSPDYGNATDEIDVEYKGTDIEVAFNYRYLTEALRSLQDEKILLELESPLSPILLKLSEKVDYSYTYLIMPVQLR